MNNQNLIQNSQRYRKTKKGVITNLYQKIKERSIKKGMPLPSFTLNDLHVWCMKQKEFHELFFRWQIGGYIKKLKPSIDRKNPFKPYSFDNMQLMTAQENREKGDREKLLLWGKPISQHSLDGMVIGIYGSIKEASRATGINRNNISSVACGKRNQAGGFVWKFIYENPDLLKAVL